MKVFCSFRPLIQTFVQKILMMTVVMSFFLIVAVIMTAFCFLVYDIFSFEGQLLVALLEMWVAL